jgi:hypothetical protein
MASGERNAGMPELLKSILGRQKIMLNHLKILRSGFLPAILVAGVMPSLTVKAAVETVGAVLPQAQTDYKDMLAVEQFNPNLGTLESVSITATGTGQFGQYYQNLSTSSGGSVTISQNFDMVLSMPSTGTMITELNVTPGAQTYSAQAYAGTPFFTGNSGGSQIYQVSNASTVTLGSSLFAAFTGSGMADFLVTANGGGGSSENTGNFLVGWSTLAGLDLSVAYTYAAIPEPATGLAGGLAVAGLLVYIGRNSRRRGALPK